MNETKQNIKVQNNIGKIPIVIITVLIIASFLIWVDNYHIENNERWKFEQSLKKYEYRLPIKINNHLEYDYTIRITIYSGNGTNYGSTAFCNGYCNTNFTDLIFVSEGGEIIKDVYIFKDFENNEGIIFISSPPGIYDIKMYYSSNQSDIDEQRNINEKVFVFSDDFE